MGAAEGIIVVQEFKVPCVCGAGILRDIGRLGLTDVVPVDSGKERVCFEVIDSIPAQSGTRFTD